MQFTLTPICWMYMYRLQIKRGFQRKHIDVITKKLDWLLGKKSHLNLENKILVYKVAIKPIWTYGIELRGCARKTNIDVMQRLQLKILRAMTNAPWYVSNDTLHNDLGIPVIFDVIKERSNEHHNRLETHTNPLMQPLLQTIKNTSPNWSQVNIWGSFGGRVPILSLSGLLAQG
jgi:hypothetical protein